MQRATGIDDDGVGERSVQRLALVALLLVACSAESAPDPTAASIPASAPPKSDRSIILISLDTLRADYIGLYGYRKHRTSPTLDAFARESVVFDASMVTEPVTLTSHMGLMTGLYPHHHGVSDTSKLPAGIATLAERLRGFGYATRAHADGGYMRPRWGIDRGFDHYRGNQRRGARRVFKEPRTWIREHQNRPFFLFLHVYDAHNVGKGPRYVAKRPFRGLFSRRLRSRSTAAVVKSMVPHFLATDRDKAFIRATYAESVRDLDAQIRDLFAFLKRRGVWDDALIILWSDHGEGLFDHGTFGHDQVFEHTARSVLMMKVPGVEGGRRVASVVREIDILPTILELVGAPPVEGIDGRSFAALLRGEATHEGFAITKLTRSTKRLFSLRTDTHRYIWDGNTNESFLFDHRVDPDETQNLSPSGGDLEAGLHVRVLAWMEEYDSTMATRAQAQPAVPLDAETRDALEALGYLN